MCTIQACTVQVCVFQVCVIQLCTDQECTVQACMAQAHVIQACTVQVCTVQLPAGGDHIVQPHLQPSAPRHQGWVPAPRLRVESCARALLLRREKPGAGCTPSILPDPVLPMGMSNGHPFPLPAHLPSG